MRLRRLERTDLPLVAGWLAQEENHRWLDFGRGRRTLSEKNLAIMLNTPVHVLLTFTAQDVDGHGEPAGIVGVSDISANFRYGTLWYVLGDKSQGGRGLTTMAARAALELAFGDLGLHSVEAWALIENQASIAILERLGFRRIGTRRECHDLGGKLHDRIYFDLLAPEFLEEGR